MTSNGSKLFRKWQLLIFFAALVAFPKLGCAWWNKDWTLRKQYTVDATDQGGAISTPIGTSVVLIRLHQGNFSFDQAKDDGSDIRFVAGDDKTVLPHQIEKYDSLLNEAFIWVKVPDIKPGAQTKFYLYFGNEGKIEEAAKSKEVYDPETVLVYHFAEKGVAAVDSSTFPATMRAMSGHRRKGR